MDQSFAKVLPETDAGRRVGGSILALGNGPLITTWSRGNADDNMPEEILTELARQVDRHPWWQARTRLALAMLEQLKVRPPARLLDAGCGWGTTLTALEKHGYVVTGLDISRRSLERLDGPGRTLIEADLTQDLPDTSDSFDAVLALDVIEHLDDDGAALRRIASLTKPGGFAIVSVPALPALFSEFDEVQGHRRRYLPETLRAAFKNTGLSVDQVLWWGDWLVPFFRAQRVRSSRKPDSQPLATYRRYLSLPPWPIPLAMKLAFRLTGLRTIGGKGRTGTSLFAIAQRRL